MALFERDSEGSGITLLLSMEIVLPKPLHCGHAPCGELNENKFGLGETNVLPLDFERVSTLSDAEISIVEASIAREVSPSDAALQAYLSVGRPRLSQIFNGLHKAGILSVRKKGRTRLFRISNQAKAHFTDGHMEA